METGSPRQPTAADVRTNTIALEMLYEALTKFWIADEMRYKARETRRKERNERVYTLLRNSLIVLALLRLGYLFSQFNVF